MEEVNFPLSIQTIVSLGENAPSSTDRNFCSAVADIRAQTKQTIL
jgi:hypothetical protein